MWARPVTIDGPKKGSRPGRPQRRLGKQVHYQIMLPRHLETEEGAGAIQDAPGTHRHLCGLMRTHLAQPVIERS